MDVRMPDGTRIQNVPEGTTQEDLQWSLDAYKDPKQMEHKESIAPRAPMRPSQWSDIPAGLSSGIGQLGQGIVQRAAELGFAGKQSGLLANAMRNVEIERRRKLEEESAKTNRSPSLAFNASEMVGMNAPVIPLMAMTGGASTIPAMASSALVGGAYSSLFPTVSNIETAMNAGIGAIGGGLGEGLARTILPTSARTMTQAQKHILDIAKRERIPLRTSEATGSSAIKNFEQMAANRPGTAGMEQRFNEVQTRAINEAVSRRFGKPLTEIGPAERLVAQKSIGIKLKNLVAGKQVRLDTDLVNAVVSLDNKYSSGGKLTMSPEMAKILDNALSESYRGQVTGETAQSIRSILLGKMRDAARAENTELADVYRNLADGLNKAIKGSMSAADASAWSATNRKYMNYKIYEDSLIPSPVEAAGDIPINRLGAALERNRPNSYFQGTNEDLAGLARLGQVIRPPGRSALLGSQGLPVVRHAEDIVRMVIQPPLQSQFIQNYLTGQLPGQRLLRDNQAAQRAMDTLMRSGGLFGLNEYNSK